MFFIKKLLWTFYLIIFSSVAIYRFHVLFSDGSAINFYFFFLNSFNSLFQIKYILAFLQGIIEIVHIAVVILFIFKIKIFSQQVFQHLLLFRIFFDLFGRSYELNYLISMYYFDPIVLAALISITLFIYYPSYMASFKYSFGKDIF